MTLKYSEGDFAVINTKVKDLSVLNGTLVEIIDVLPSHYYQDYIVKHDNDKYTLSNNRTIRLLETELQEIENEILPLLREGQEVIYEPLNKTATIAQINYLYEQAAISFPNRDGTQVVSVKDLRLKKESVELEKSSNEQNKDSEKVGRFTEIAMELGQFTDKKNKQYGSSVDATYEIIKVLMERYTYDEESYLMPKSLLQHILLQVRMMDKQNRLFNNPSGEGDSESPYKDLVGYSLIGVDMVNRNNVVVN